MKIPTKLVQMKIPVDLLAIIDGICKVQCRTRTAEVIMRLKVSLQKDANQQDKTSNCTTNNAQ